MKKLYLEFLDEAELTMKIVIDDPKDNLDKTFVSSKMNELISAGAFQNKQNEIKSAKSAYIIETTKTEIL